MRTHTLIMVTLLLLLALGLAACGDKPLLYDVSFGADQISPNADGQNDIVLIKYGLGRSADVSIYLIDSAGERHYFRRDEPRAPRSDYQVYFGGVINDRMLPDGTYTWVVEAVDQEGERAEERGTLTLSEADTFFPEISQFTLDRQVFTPNRDGLSDRVIMTLAVEKDVEQLQVYLRGENGVRYPVDKEPGLREPGEAGVHQYDYDGGVDDGAEPPDDGTYVVYAVAQDKVGQRDLVTRTLTIEGGGVPKAEILQATVDWSATWVVLSQTLCFTTTVNNYGPVPIRTSGPPPGTPYRDDQNYNTLGYGIAAGGWRVGVENEASLSSYPYRWAVGEADQLIEVVIAGQTYSYLPAGARGRVYGCVQLTEVPVPNPLEWWVGLIHERVEITNINNHVDPIFVEVQRR